MVDVIERSEILQEIQNIVDEHLHLSEIDWQVIFVMVKTGKKRIKEKYEEIKDLEYKVSYGMFKHIVQTICENKVDTQFLVESLYCLKRLVWQNYLTEKDLVFELTLKTQRLICECGHINQIGSIYCGNCGTKLPEEGETI